MRSFLCRPTRHFLSDEKGASAIEYGLIAALIALSIIAGLSGVGTKLADNFNEIDSAVEGSR